MVTEILIWCKIHMSYYWMALNFYLVYSFLFINKCIFSYIHTFVSKVSNWDKNLCHTLEWEMCLFQKLYSLTFLPTRDSILIWYIYSHSLPSVSFSYMHRFVRKVWQSEMPKSPYGIPAWLHCIIQSATTPQLFSSWYSTQIKLINFYLRCISHSRESWFWWLSARLQYLQCISTGDTPVLRQAIDMQYLYDTMMNLRN